MSTLENNKRIAKNTLFLYFRLLITMGISLYTVRIVLNTLGVEDYGIYNVVGGIVTMFAFLSGAMASGAQRFFAFELGREDYTRLKQTFSLTLIIYAGIASIILLLAETVGLWFLNTQMTIPQERMIAANWVYQFSIFSFIATVVTVPYTASIIAHENMKIYAYSSIIDAILKFIIVYLLGLFLYDKLKVYAVLMFLATLIVIFIYYIYCKRKYAECTFKFYWEKKLAVSLFSYSGWNMIGAVASIAKNQGINILLNIFFGPVVNAARAVAFLIYSALSQVVVNIYSSTRPQITKYYAQKEIGSMWKLVFDSTKYSYYLFMIISIPFFFEVEYIIYIWIGQVPQYAPVITRLILAGFMLEALSNQLVACLQAANKLRKFQSVSSSILLLNIPVSLVLLKLGGSPYLPFIISIIITIIYMISQIWITWKEVGLPVKLYLKEILRIEMVTISSLVLPYLIYRFIDVGLGRFILLITTSCIISVICIWWIGLESKERNIVQVYIKGKFKKSR